MVAERSEHGQGAGVLFSSGLDSAVLLAHAARNGPAHPLYVKVGLAWETEEVEMARRLLTSGRLGAQVGPLTELHFDMRDVYLPDHWAIRGEPPAFDTSDDDVYLAGRNITLLSKAAVHAARSGLARLVIGPLAGNRFPDASREFFDAMERALTIGLNTNISIEAPFAAMHKAEVIKLGASLEVPFELTMSCMRPARGTHCGRCSKCRERLMAFRDAGLTDPAVYRKVSKLS